MTTCTHWSLLRFCREIGLFTQQTAGIITFEHACISPCQLYVHKLKIIIKKLTSKFLHQLYIHLYVYFMQDLLTLTLQEW